MISPEKARQLRTQMLEHLESALAIADETQDAAAGYLIEQALNSIRAAHWPDMVPSLERFRKGKR